MTKKDVWREARISAWLLAGTSIGAAGACITGIQDHPLRHILPDAINYFQHSGNMAWGGFLGAAAVVVATRLENRRDQPLTAGKFAAASMLSGLAVGGVANAAYETEIGYELVGQHLGLQGGKTAEPWDLVWGAAFTSLMAAGLGGDLRRHDQNRAEPLALPETSLPGPEVVPDITRFTDR
jgi:prolipoprotein diacylglyceryltransferase